MDEIPLERRRMLAAEMLLRSERPMEISRRTGLSLPTLRNYKALLDGGGPDALARLGPHGKKSRLDDNAQSWLISAVKHSPELHGFSTPVWTVDQVRSVILARYGIQYSSSHVARMMRDWGLGYRLTYTSVVTEAKGRAQRRLSVSGEISTHGFLRLDRAAYVHLIDRWTYDAESLRSVEA
ncbi:winged helix-turn-helix domain-containing protein [Paraburkholderia sp. FT54]|uniref:winged helix-turn-helix domain-containing protein n=1 Tax=Paraburkholderia sp. FT54 TaxID=3074437 RepID=UPI0038F61FF8